ncbi:adenosylcobinamide-GDP ribazoletransferase [Hippea alviniae]|uniref:adenosylcobinamide-GDP ribazoletransferase n=1 Tax=Hippea alviniae TaxID=1279027 RepID=UPI0003B3B3F3|nr:adenosylcobinamide-GDP ribazoletransferase [Hippea alviniae]
MNSLLSALSFLTIIRINCKFNAKESVKFFPVVGLLIGAGLYGLSFLKEPFSVFFMLFYLVFITGGLHIDGLADASDAFFSHRDRDEMLKIMKDSRIGTFGVLAIFFVLFAKLLGFFVVKDKLFYIFLPAYSRFSVVYLMKKLPYGREKGTAHDFFKEFKFFDFAFGYIIVVLSFFVLPIRVALIVNFAFFLYVFFIFEYFKKKLGVITGDMLGFSIETTEALLLIILSLVSVYAKTWW